jgi:hypothetical protein
MSSSPSAPKRALSINTGVPTAQIFIIDGYNNVVARGVQSIVAELPVGLYKVRFKVGNSVADKLIELPEGPGPYTPTDLPAIPMVSPVPLSTPGTQSQSLTPGIASRWSNTVHVSHGQGSRVFLFADAPEGLPQSPPILPGTVTLNTFDGVQIASLAQGVAEQGCFGCTVEVDPGGYFLRTERGDSPAVCQAVYTAPQWQTQVFLPILQWSGFSTVDLSACSILMSPVRLGFRPDAQSFLWAEAARKTLASGRASVTPAQQLRGMQAVGVDDAMIEDMLHGKFLNPMLGIYGAHLMVMQDSPDNQDVLHEVVPNLQRLVGELPDVTSLLLHLGDPRASTLSYPIPPMLAASWSLIVKNSPNQSNLVPARSFSANIAGSLWGSGAWLGWKAVAVQAAAPAEDTTDVDWDLLKQIAGSDPLRISHSDLNPAERAVMSYVTIGASRYSLISKTTPAPGTDTEAQQTTPATVSAATGIPYSVILDAAASLTRKLK